MSVSGDRGAGEEDVAILAFVGDVMLGRGVNAKIARRSPKSFWGSALPVLRTADAVFANLECAITRHARPWSRTAKAFHFRADPGAIAVLRAANVRYVSLANNHSLDFEEEGLLDTLDHLDAVGIRHAGAGRNLEEAMAPAIIDAGRLRIGVLSLTDREPPFAAGPRRPGTYYTEIATTAEILDPVGQRLAALRAAGADLVVLSIHWGPNMMERPPERIRAFAHAALEHGADLVHGHSAHLFQALEHRDRRLILYDTGDFLDDYAVDPVLRNDRSFIFLVEVDRRGIRRLRMRPVRLRHARVDLAIGDDFDAACGRMRRLCAVLGTPLTGTADGLELSIPP